MPILYAPEDTTMKKIFRNWNGILQALVLIKIGQDLGCDTKYSRMIHDFIEIFLTILK
jgi:hypothetical protein